MVTIELEKPWTFRTPLVTVPYSAGTHEVFQYIADQAEKEGALKQTTKEETDDESKQPAKARKARAADKSES